MVTPIQTLEGGDYRVAQTDHGGPFIQFLDDKTKIWVAVRKRPEKIGELEALLAKYASKAKRFEAEAIKLRGKLSAYENGFKSRGAEIETLKETQRHLTELAGE